VAAAGQGRPHLLPLLILRGGCGAQQALLPLVDVKGGGAKETATTSIPGGCGSSPFKSTWGSTSASFSSSTSASPHQAAPSQAAKGKRVPALQCKEGLKVRRKLHCSQLFFMS